jgi:hypothetical protein
LEGELSFVYLYVGAMNRVLEFPERFSELGYLNTPGIGTLWLPEYAPARKTERFKALMRATGLVDYWRARGWPEQCHPVGSADFVCD